VITALSGRIERLAVAERYEDAAAVRDRLGAFVRVAARMQRLVALTACAEVVAARPAGGGWELAVVRHGRLVAAGQVPRGCAPRPQIDALLATAEAVVPGPGPLPAATAEETECILRWLESPGIRLVQVSGDWCSPSHGAGGHRARLADGTDGRLGDQRRSGEARHLRPVARPVPAVPGAYG
jgi:DNA polymerase-3 subunit epsilon